MRYWCPACKQQAIEMSGSLSYGPDGMSDENVLRIVECRACPFRALSTYEESRRGSMDRDELWHRDGWHVTPEVFERVSAGIRACPSPNNERCRCKAHRWMDRGGWGVVTGLRKGGIELGEHFSLSTEAPDSPS